MYNSLLIKEVRQTVIAKTLIVILKYQTTMSKLQLIAETISEVLYDNFKIRPDYIFEEKLKWLTTHPQKELFQNSWQIIKEKYQSVTDNKFDLDVLEKDDLYRLKNENQYVDIWFSKPYNFIVEFDEKQHFNQYRLATLTDYNSEWIIGDLNIYMENCRKKTLKPGISGFQKIKENLLFPHFYPDSEKQDNRIRQRAFRDFLKDYLPIQFDLNPTLRIPYTVTNKKNKDFNHSDLEKLKLYLIETKLCERLKIEKHHS
ncbi:hypothetical protein [uncultured Flavobacterium sp.]|uniref:DUF7255 family protein n=1 Tax=uncultured Flavobacterium sp. TaxID=165435 RepID=UPI0012168CFC|nr:hypothetical protein [uncultured Flavobacterium sp.]THD30070.1 MAG: hypothetical protein DI588_17340 [Flavobacterium johnsoniae]